MSHHNKANRGFTLIEVLVAVLVFGVGMVMLGSLATLSLNGTASSRYRGMATTFASEKLEDLNRYPTGDPQVCVSSGTAGSLTSDAQQPSLTCNGNTATVDYYDDVSIGDGSGQVCETVSSVVGSSTLKSTCHTPGGMTTTSTTATASTIDAGAVAFHRRWTIEANQPITGVKRITVLVTLENGYMNPPISVQESMVRP